MLTPEYVTTQEYVVKIRGAEKTLPAGSFVKIVSSQYVPDFTKETYPTFFESNDCYCFTAFGLVPLPKMMLRVR